MNDVPSLRSVIEKWLAPTPGSPIRVTRFGRANPRQMRCVLVQSAELKRPLSIFFFQHEDRSWRVFPPAARGPEMHAYLGAG